MLKAWPLNTEIKSNCAIDQAEYSHLAILTPTPLKNVLFEAHFLLFSSREAPPGTNPRA